MQNANPASPGTTDPNPIPPSPASVPFLQTQVRLLPFDLTTGASVLTGPAAGTPGAPVACVSIVFFADPGNASNVYLGANGSATMPLAAGVGGALDAPVGAWFDLASLSVSGNGTLGLVVHVLALIV